MCVNNEFMLSKNLNLGDFLLKKRFFIYIKIENNKSREFVVKIVIMLFKVGMNVFLLICLL